MLRAWLQRIDQHPKEAEELLAACLERIRAREPEVQAWVTVRPQPYLPDRPLSGIPFGVKDIFETPGLPTEYGSALFRGRTGSQEAGLVRLLRDLGGLELGKTRTAAFASFDPPETRNPRFPAHTPGGSSSGSAAAVAAGMAPFAIGSQTLGSVLRPASFCGVCGFKPTHGVLPLDGALGFAPSLDTAGLFTESAADMAELWSRMGYGRNEPRTSPLAALAPAGGVEPEMCRAFDEAVEVLGATRIPLPGAWGDLEAAAHLINDYEGSRTHEHLWKQHGAAMGAKLSRLIANGLEIPAERYEAALATVNSAAAEINALYGEFSVLLYPAATGPAPEGLESTGDPRMNAPWTALGVPAVSVPLPTGGALPLGLQLTAARGRDAFLLAAAAHIEQQLPAVL